MRSFLWCTKHYSNGFAGGALFSKLDVFGLRLKPRVFLPFWNIVSLYPDRIQRTERWKASGWSHLDRICRICLFWYVVVISHSESTWIGWLNFLSFLKRISASFCGWFSKQTRSQWWCDVRKWDTGQLAMQCMYIVPLVMNALLLKDSFLHGNTATLR